MSEAFFKTLKDEIKSKVDIIIQDHIPEEIKNEYNITTNTENYNLPNPYIKLVLKFEPKPRDLVFKVNEFLILKLEKGKTNIYIKNRRFNQCKYLIFLIFLMLFLFCMAIGTIALIVLILLILLK